MKTRCPFCRKISKVPDLYQGKCLKCPGCKESFLAEPYKKPPIVVPEIIPPAAHKTGFFLKKLWTRCPPAFRTGFLATLGVISALWVTINFIGPGAWLRRPGTQRTSYTPPLDDRMLDSYYLDRIGGIMGAGQKLSQLCESLGSLKIAADLKSTSMSDNTRAKIRNYLDHEITFLDHSFDVSSLRKAKDALIDALSAEIDVLEFELEYPIKDSRILENEDYMQLMERSISLRSEAFAEIDKLMNKI